MKGATCLIAALLASVLSLGLAGAAFGAYTKIMPVGWNYDTGTWKCFDPETGLPNDCPIKIYWKEQDDETWETTDAGTSAYVSGVFETPGNYIFKAQCSPFDAEPDPVRSVLIDKLTVVGLTSWAIDSELPGASGDENIPLNATSTGSEKYKFKKAKVTFIATPSTDHDGGDVWLTASITAGHPGTIGFDRDGQTDKSTGSVSEADFHDLEGVAIGSYTVQLSPGDSGLAFTNGTKSGKVFSFGTDVSPTTLTYSTAGAGGTQGTHWEDCWARTHTGWTFFTGGVGSNVQVCALKDQGSPQKNTVKIQTDPAGCYTGSVDATIKAELDVGYILDVYGSSGSQVGLTVQANSPAFSVGISASANPGGALTAFSAGVKVHDLEIKQNSAVTHATGEYASGKYQADKSGTYSLVRQYADLSFATVGSSERDLYTCASVGAKYITGGGSKHGAIGSIGSMLLTVTIEGSAEPKE